MNVQSAVLERYSQGAKDVQPSLCCPVGYDPKLLALLPQEIVAKDYGCGDPSRYVRPGDAVLDLGSGGGKICYMAAQLVGPEGLVIGVDMNHDMLALARKYQNEMAQKLGGERVEFRKGYIQDLALDVAAMERYLAEQRRPAYVEHSLETICGEHGWCIPNFDWPLPNVWVGTSISNQPDADEKFLHLLRTKAAVRFVSIEPMLGPVDLWCARYDNPNGGKTGAVTLWPGGLDWVICGGESGPNARPMHPDWARSLRDQCQAAHVPFFFKQWGEWDGTGLLFPPEEYRVPVHDWGDGNWSLRVGKKAAGRLLDGRVWNEFPMSNHG